MYRRRFLSRRVGVRMRARGVGDPAAYCDLLVRDPAEYSALLEALNINLSYFMRDAEAYKTLAQKVIPALIAARRRAGRRSLAVWSAGCAGGEEPYSAAMLLADALGPELPYWQIRIDATDRSAAALSRARAGVYHAASFRTTDADYIRRYFSREDGTYRVSPEIRAMVTWHCSAIDQSPPLSSYDLILCRNVLIYYVHERQEQIVAHLLRCLAPTGYLMLGMAERVPGGARSVLEGVDARARVFRSVPPQQERCRDA